MLLLSIIVMLLGVIGILYNYKYNLIQLVLVLEIIWIGLILNIVYTWSILNIYILIVIGVVIITISSAESSILMSLVITIVR